MKTAQHCHSLRGPTGRIAGLAEAGRRHEAEQGADAVIPWCDDVLRKRGGDKGLL